MPVREPQTSGGDGPMRELDQVAAQLLGLGWVVRCPRQAQQGTALALVVSRSPFDADPATVLLRAHHHLELELPHAAAVTVDDVEDLHHHLNDADRRTA